MKGKKNNEEKGKVLLAPSDENKNIYNSLKLNCTR